MKPSRHLITQNNLGIPIIIYFYIKENRYEQNHETNMVEKHLSKTYLYDVKLCNHGNILEGKTSWSYFS